MSDNEPRVFISYAREDFDIAKRLYEDLKHAGAQPWLDAEDLLTGQQWKSEIRKAIKNSDYFVALLSSRAVTKRGFVQSELKHALEILEDLPESEIFVIPARLDPCEASHERLEELHWVDLFPSFEEGFRRIASVVFDENKSGTQERLIDQGIQLLRARQEGHKTKFRELIEPVYNDFEDLHRDYLRCFDGYRTQLTEAQILSANHPILDQIYKDHLFSQGLRSKIQAAFALFPEDPYAHKWDPATEQFVPPSADARKRDELEEFIYAISGYITGVNYYVFDNDHFMYSNCPRSSLMTGLKYILSMSEDEIREIASKLNSSPLIFITNPQGTTRDYYLFACFFSSDGSFAPGMQARGIWKQLQNRLDIAAGNTTEAQKAIGIALIDKIVHDINCGYRNVTEAYTALKRKAVG
jgi:hypothetical protein